VRARFVAAGLVLACAAGVVHADLYLWKDPATGAVKIYSYPPPWYGNPALERRSPKVERIPERQRAPVVRPERVPLASPPPVGSVAGLDEALPPPPGAAGSPAPALLGPLEAQRKRLLGVLADMRVQQDPGLQRQFEAYRGLADQMDRIDPAGAESRAAEFRALIERLR